MSFSAYSYKSLPFTGINIIDAYFSESNGTVAWNSDRYLGPEYSINDSTVVSFRLKDNNALLHSDIKRLI